jgi:succinate dehydrogenase assembly factor 2
MQRLLLKRGVRSSAILLQETSERIIKVDPPKRPANEPIDVKRARLLYSSRKRGILETDLILSTFIKENLQKMDMKELNEMDKLMEENDWDVFYWLTGNKTPPEHISNLSVLPRLVEHVKNKDKKKMRMPDL